MYKNQWVPSRLPDFTNMSTSRSPHLLLLLSTPLDSTSKSWWCWWCWETASGQTKTSDRVYSHSTNLHWFAAKWRRSIISYRRRTVCLFPDPLNLLPDLATAEPTFADHITDCDKGGEYQRPWFATASDLLWCAACYEHPYTSPYPQCDSGFVCCHTVCLTVARPSVVESTAKNGRWRSHPSSVCCQTDCLSVARRLVSVARRGDVGANPLFVCCHLSNEKGGEYQCP